MLDTIANLPNRYNIFTQSKYAIYILDDYSVHITDKVRNASLAKGYILVVIGGGITGDVQCNDTHIHRLLEKNYRQLEANLVMEMLRKDSNKIPSPSRDDIMKMLNDAWNSLDVDVEEALKQNFLTSAFDGSEDYKVSEKLYSLVFEETNDFRQELQCSPSPKPLKDLLVTITPPKGVRRKSSMDEVPVDEEIELYDCESEEMEIDESEEVDENEEFDTDDEDVDMAAEIVRKSKDEAIAQEILQSLVEKVVKTEQKNPLLRRLSTELDEDIKKDVLFLDKIMNAVQNKENPPLFTPFVIKLEQICNAGRVSLCKRIKTNQRVKGVVQSGNNNAAIARHGDSTSNSDDEA